MVTLKISILFTIIFFSLVYGLYGLFSGTKRSNKNYFVLTFFIFSIINLVEIVFYFPEVKNKIASFLGILYYQKETLELLIITCVALHIGREQIKNKWLHFIPATLSFIFSIIYFGVNGGNQIYMAKCHWYIWPDLINFSYIFLQLIQVAFYILFFYKVALNIADNDFKFLFFKTIVFCKILYLTDFFLAVLFKDHLQIQTPIYFGYKLLFLLSLTIIFLVELKNNHIENTIEKLSTKYSRSKLTEKNKQEIFIKIKNYMENEQPYLNQDFSLETMADKLNILRTHISRTINEKCQMNFREYINSYRINESIRLINEAENYSINQIYFEAGFNSKSVFNTVFKKRTGITPTQHRNSHF